ETLRNVETSAARLRWMLGALRTQVLAWDFTWERVTGIEPALSAWEADVLPLNYTRAALGPNRASARPDIVPEPTTANRFSRPRPRPRAGAAWPAARRTPAPALQPGPPVPGSGGSPRA